MLRTALFLLSLALSGPVFAVADACQFWTFIGNFIPGHPGPNDPISYAVGGYFPPQPGGATFQRVTRQGNRIDIDLVVSDSPAPPPFGYDTVPSASGLPPTGGLQLGPLPPGEYALFATVRDISGAPRGPCIGTRSGVLIVGTSSGAVVVVDVVEFYHAALDHYFMTANTAEIRDLDDGRHVGWTRTGESFKAYARDGSDHRGARIQRWYGLPSAGLNTHFYSAGGELSDYVPPDQQAKWLFEGLVFEMGIPASDGTCAAGTVPVHRLWNGRSDSNHRYTTKASVKQEMMARGYIAEGYGATGVMLCAVAE